MDTEFHYYMTYLIAIRARFHPAEATTLAQAAQEIDDNHIPISVSKGTPAEYESVISQTVDILRPKAHLFDGDDNGIFLSKCGLVVLSLCH